MNPEQFKAYRHDAYHSLERLNQLLERDFRIGTWRHWEYDLDLATLTFSSDGIPRVSATIQAVGSTSNKSGTWLWGWANRGLPSKVTEQLSRVRAFGEREGLQQLTDAKFPGDESVGWEMTAIATRLLDGKGAYRCPSEFGFIFLMFTDIYFVESDRKAAVKTSDRAKIRCSDHATGFETFVCEHLAKNPAQVWFSEVPGETNPWPDAWCATCDRVLQEHKGWDNVKEGHAKSKLLCHRCYERARSSAKGAVKR